jgi:hypothetical protein
MNNAYSFPITFSRRWSIAPCLSGKGTSDSFAGGQGLSHFGFWEKSSSFPSGERIFPKNLDRPESSTLIRPKQGTTDRRMTHEKKKFMTWERLIIITKQRTPSLWNLQEIFSM